VLELLSERRPLLTELDRIDDFSNELAWAPSFAMLLRQAELFGRVSSLSQNLIRDAEGSTDHAGRAAALFSAALSDWSFAARGVAIEQLTQARSFARLAKHDELELRISAELALGLGWVGRAKDANEHAQFVFRHPIRATNPWVDRHADLLRALSIATGGDLIGGAKEVVRLAEIGNCRSFVSRRTCFASRATLRRPLQRSIELWNSQLVNSTALQSLALPMSEHKSL
jgi:hypothetical protein